MVNWQEFQNLSTHNHKIDIYFKEWDETSMYFRGYVVFLNRELPSTSRMKLTDGPLLQAFRNHIWILVEVWNLKQNDEGTFLKLS